MKVGGDLLREELCGFGDMVYGLLFMVAPTWLSCLWQRLMQNLAFTVPPLLPLYQLA